MVARNRFLVIRVDGGLVGAVTPHSDWRTAKRLSDSIARKLDPDDHDVVIWDLDEDAVVYNPFRSQE